MYSKMEICLKIHHINKIEPTFKSQPKKKIKIKNGHNRPTRKVSYFPRFINILIMCRYRNEKYYRDAYILVILFYLSHHNIISIHVHIFSISSSFKLLGYYHHRAVTLHTNMILAYISWNYYCLSLKKKKTNNNNR